MLRSFANMFKNKEIRKKIFFTLAMLLIYRIGSSIPVPGIDAATLAKQISDNSILSMMNLLGGGALEKMSIFAMGVSPYITASIIIQLLSMDVIPSLTEWAKSGQTGRQKIEKTTRYLGVVLAFVQAFSLVYGFDKQYAILESSALSTYLYVATILCAGTMFLVWIGDRISMKGIGNGISIIIFAGIVSNMPTQFAQIYSILVGGTSNGEVFNGVLQFVLYCLIYLAIVVFVVIMETAVRKIPIQYTNSISNRGGKSDVTFLPFKINSASVIPVIFASSIMAFPVTIASLIGKENIPFIKLINTACWFDPKSPIYSFGAFIYLLLIVLYSYFYTNITFNATEVAHSIQKSDGIIPGIRSGQNTVAYLKGQMKSLIFIGAICMSIIAMVPIFISAHYGLSRLSFLGTSVIITVSVITDTKNQVLSQRRSKKYIAKAV